MTLDTITLMMAGSVTTALAGLALFGVWTQLRHEMALLWWSAANIAYAAGIAVFAVGPTGTDLPAIVIGAMLSNAAAPMIWIGAVTFNRQKIPVAAMLAGLSVWLLIEAGAHAIFRNPYVGLTGWVVWLLLSAFELWRGRAERIPAREPLIAFLVIHALVNAGGVYDVLAGDLQRDSVAPLNSWFGAILIEGIVYAMASAVFMAMLCKERETQKYMRAARSDPLTGIANRSALMESAERLFERSRKDGTPFSVIMFDLDHFKTINDIHGHRRGDDVLRAFAVTVRKILRPADSFGRYGGEEFTVILPKANVETAHVIAERVRHAFAEQHRFLDGQRIDATVSGGVAEAGAAPDFEDVLDAADQAMYQAKSLGRNRVERVEPARPADGQENVIRVA
jgi:diguanylate cyclase (GGDEF)-like protein